MKDWFSRRRTGLSNTDVGPELPSAKSRKGVPQPLLAQEGVEILRGWFRYRYFLEFALRNLQGFALDCGRYPSSDELETLVERVWVSRVLEISFASSSLNAIAGEDRVSSTSINSEKMVHRTPSSIQPARRRHCTERETGCGESSAPCY